MNNRHQEPLTRRSTFPQKTQGVPSGSHLSRSTVPGYPSLSEFFTGMLRSPLFSKVPQQNTIPKDQDHNLSNNERGQDQQLVRSPTGQSEYTKRLPNRPIHSTVRDKVCPYLLPNRQKITQKLFNILRERAGLIEQDKVEPLFMETTLALSNDDVRLLFSRAFVDTHHKVTKSLNCILKCFAVYRLDIGQRKAVALLSGVFFGILNQDVLLTFVQLSHAVLSPVFLGFLLQHETTINRVQRKVDWMLQEDCPGLHVVLFNKYKISLRHYLGQWIGSGFLCLQLDGTSTELDRYYQDNEDPFMMKVLNYLLYCRFSEQALVKTTVCMMKSLQKQIIRQEIKENVVNILKRPRSFVDETVLLKSILS